jgi:hypothetical protein
MKSSPTKEYQKGKKKKKTDAAAFFFFFAFSFDPRPQVD